MHKNANILLTDALRCCRSGVENITNLRSDGNRSNHAYINLKNYIANNDGKLAWRHNGGFQESCRPSYITRNHVLISICKTENKSLVEDAMDLNENILNDNGNLLYVGP